MFKPFTSSDKMPETNHLVAGQSDTTHNGTIVSKWYRNSVCVLITRQLPSGTVECYRFSSAADYPNHRQTRQSETYRWLVGAYGAEFPSHW